jgi:hypothetical protein
MKRQVYFRRLPLCEGAGVSGSVCVGVLGGGVPPLFP